MKIKRKRQAHSTSNDMWLRDMGTEQHYDGKACSHTEQDGTHNARHHPPRLKRSTWIQQEICVSDIINIIRKAKHRWAGHIAWLSDNRWTIRATEWTPRDWTRKQGRLKMRWRDDNTIVESAESRNDIPLFMFSSSGTS